MPPRFLSILALLSLLIPMSCAGPDSARIYHKEGKTVYRDLVYSTVKGEKLLLDIYLPPQFPREAKTKSKPVPVVIWIHGGGWRWGSKKTVPVIDLTHSGFALVSINYRLDGHVKYPAQIDDTRAALRWIKAHGSEFHLNTNRIGVIGASAGAHLAAMLGTTGGDSPEFPRVQAVCALYPPTNLATVVGKNNQDRHIALVPLLLGGSVNEKRALAESGSPIRYVTPDDAPFFFIHGALDTLVPIEQSISMNKALEKAGVASHLKTYPDKKHGFYPDEPLTREIADFFHQKLGY